MNAAIICNLAREILFERLVNEQAAAIVAARPRRRADARAPAVNAALASPQLADGDTSPTLAGGGLTVRAEKVVLVIDRLEMHPQITVEPTIVLRPRIDIAPADVTIQVPEAPPAVVHVDLPPMQPVLHLPSRDRRVTFQRDANGNPTSAEISDA